MDIKVILALALGTLLVGWVVPRRRLVPVLLLGSLLALFWLQPSTPIRNLDFWLPTASIALTLLVWAVTAPAEGRTLRSNPARPAGDPGRAAADRPHPLPRPAVLPEPLPSAADAAGAGRLRSHRRSISGHLSAAPQPALAALGGHPAHSIPVHLAQKPSGWRA